MSFKLLKNKEKTQEKTVSENKKTREKSRGRSMVEMLGVLAIIGVLSIGGIQGYTLAMRRYRANEILDSANKFATIYYTSCQNAMDKDPESYYITDNRAGYPHGLNAYWWHCPAMAFSDAGIKDIFGAKYRFVQVATAYDSKDDARSTGFNDGSDFVSVSIHLNSRSLAKTIYSMVNTKFMNEDFNSYCYDDYEERQENDCYVVATFPVN